MNAQCLPIAAVAAVLLLAPAVSGQTATGQLNGTVSPNTNANTAPGPPPSPSRWKP
jgi:hypothetical protein